MVVGKSYLLHKIGSGFRFGLFIYETLSHKKKDTEDKTSLIWGRIYSNLRER